jgi:hypothetical protein
MIHFTKKDPDPVRDRSRIRKLFDTILSEQYSEENIDPWIITTVYENFYDGGFFHI